MWTECCCAPATARKGDRPGLPVTPGCQVFPGGLFAAVSKLKAGVRADLRFLED